LLKTNDEVLSGNSSARASLREAQQQLQQLTTGSRSEDIKSAAAQVLLGSGRSSPDAGG